MDFDADRIYYSHQNLQQQQPGENGGTASAAVEDEDDRAVDSHALRRHYREFLSKYVCVFLALENVSVNSSLTIDDGIRSPQETIARELIDTYIVIDCSGCIAVISRLAMSLPLRKTWKPMQSMVVARAWVAIGTPTNATST